MNTLKQRMYHLTMYNISEIQKGIQSYHAGMEYAIQHWHSHEFQRWVQDDKTVIILSGGTSNNQPLNEFGSMEKALVDLKTNNIPFAVFREPDLNGATSGIAFLCDETVWDKETYPDPVVAPDPAWEVLSKEDRRIKVEVEFDIQIAKRYGEKVAFLREWLKQFRLA